MTERELRKDFFVSYTSADRTWAEWIAWQLEQAGYSVIIQAWDFQAGSNFVLEMDTAARTAERTIAILSPSYFKSDFTPSEWAAAFRRDPKGEQYALVPVRIRPFEAEGLLGSIVSIDLVGHDEQTARTLLLAGVRGERAKPAVAPLYPMGPPPGAERPAFPGALPTLWNVPYPHNPLFTGREELLVRLATALQPGQAAALSQPFALSGLGGIGKTHLAVEYAYQHRQDYQAVFWVRADTRENLVSDFVTIAGGLQLPEKDAREVQQTVFAVQAWLRTHGDWLLILDNADTLELAREFLPPSYGGQVLLTTRAQAMGRLAERIEVDTMPQEVGVLLLLRRAGLLVPDAALEHASPQEREQAGELVGELGGLPLALDQAGAYMEETPCGIGEYLRLYRTRRDALLKRREGLVKDHPASVATAWSLSFASVEQANPAAADLLRLCAFLHPDAIPEELLRQGMSQLEPPLQAPGTDDLAFHEAVRTLGAYSLLRRDRASQTLSIHRLVQAVLIDAMSQETIQAWVERTTRLLYAARPEAFEVTFPHWEAWKRLLPHVLTWVAHLQKVQLVSLEAANLLCSTGWYLGERAQYAEAEPLLQQALARFEQQQGSEHLDTAYGLTTLGWLYRLRGKDGEALPLYQRALAIYEQQLGPLHPDTRIVRANYADFLRSLHREAEARQLETRSAESSQ